MFVGKREQRSKPFFAFGRVPSVPQGKMETASSSDLGLSPNAFKFGAPVAIVGGGRYKHRYKMHSFKLQGGEVILG